MAPALTSSSFRLSSGLGAKPESKGAPKAASVIYARQNLFEFGRRKKGASEDETQAEGSAKPNRFFIDFGKIGDAKSVIPVVSTPSTYLFLSRRRKDPRTVFVAGATGQAGVRIVQTLLRQGFAVRAGVPDLPSAQELARIAATYKVITPEESKRLNAVESTFDEAESIAKAIGPAAKVVVTIGPAEKGPSATVTTNDALQVVRAAQLAGVGHVAVVYDSGTGISGPSTYNVLDGITSFFSNLFDRSQPLTLGEFLSKVVETDVSYTLIKTCLTEDYATESSYPLVVSKEGTSLEAPTKSRVARSQIATLVADVFSNTSIAENKVVEVSTSPSSTSKPIVDLFSAIPEDGRRKAYAEAVAKAKAEEEAIIASEKAREAAEAAKKLEEEMKKLSEQEVQAASLAEEAREKVEAAGASLDELLSRAKGFGAEFSWEKLSSQIATAVAQNTDDKPKTQIATVRGQAKARNLPPQKAVIKQPAQKSKPKQPDGPDQKAEVRNVFGGLFKQETIYVDDD
ncbi:protein PLASTID TRANSCRIPTIONALLY ACTIVE 16, chloroplastic isoform X2 [Elaeis guineensis]|uniref:Protein PLASTID TRANSCRIPTIONALLY ACTIVE 16, chloroplastic n=1 Tax=Elaeis guineensis var. tenera TaxID=51953 RepID=A0A6I9RB44_ELAGV|nr:protein PLASTID TRANSCRIPTIONALLY ACTIVE 16, chloroplastic [Elaeis guineensis]